ncbi:MAG: MerR family transcriptional regulator [Candidatus Rokuibacteriota bacterium]
MALSIGRVAKTTGVTAKTIRYYEQVGALPPPKRTVVGYRQYTERDVHHLVFIRRGRALGMSLHDLKTLTIALDGRPRTALRPRLLGLVRAHLSTVQRRIDELELLQRQLEQVLHRLLAPARQRAGEACRCLDVDQSPERSGRSSNHR